MHWRDLGFLRRDPPAIRAMAKGLLMLDEDVFADWELDILDASAVCNDEISPQEARRLVAIRDAVAWHQTAGGFSVKHLIDGCYQARYDLDEADEAWIADVRAEHESLIRGREAGRLLRCARELRLIG
jgi:hypothetical protein